MKMDGLKERIQQLLQKKYLFPVSAVLLLMVVIVRIIQLNVAIDYTTGFFSKNSWSMPLLAVVMILFFVYAVWQTVHRKFQISYPYHEMNLKPAAIVCFALGGVMMLSGFAQILGWSANTGDAKILELLAMLFCIAAGGAFLYHGYLMFAGAEDKLQNHCLLAVAVLWSVLNLMSNFIRHTTIASISEYLFDFLFCAASVLFLLYYAKFTAGIDGKKGDYPLLTGFSAVLLGAVSSIPPLFCGAFWKLGISQYVNPVSIILTVFIGYMMFLFITDAMQENKGSAGVSPWRDALECEYQYESVRVGNLKWSH